MNNSAALSQRIVVSTSFPQKLVSYTLVVPRRFFHWALAHVFICPGRGHGFHPFATFFVQTSGVNQSIRYEVMLIGMVRPDHSYHPARG